MICPNLTFQPIAWARPFQLGAKQISPMGTSVLQQQLIKIRAFCMLDGVHDTGRTGQTLLTEITNIQCMCIYMARNLISSPVLLLQRSSSRKSTSYRSNISALGQPAAWHCQQYIVPLHIPQQKCWWQTMTWP